MVGMSGGVDSSVAALLLTRRRADIAGLFMQNWEEDERFGECQADRDRADALRVCSKLGIAFHTARTHLQHIYKKLHVQSRTEAVVKYLRDAPREF